MPASGSKVGLQWFLFTWIKENIVGVLNKEWVVQLPPNSGTGVVRDSKRKVTIDLSQATLGGGSIDDQEIVINNDGSSFVTITGDVTDGVITLNFEWTTTDCSA